MEIAKIFQNLIIVFSSLTYLKLIFCSYVTIITSKITLNAI